MYYFVLNCLEQSWFSVFSGCLCPLQRSLNSWFRAASIRPHGSKPCLLYTSGIEPGDTLLLIADGARGILIAPPSVSDGLADRILNKEAEEK